MEATLTKPVRRRLASPEKKVSIEDYFRAEQSLFTKTSITTESLNLWLAEL